MRIQQGVPQRFQTLFGAAIEYQVGEASQGTSRQAYKQVSILQEAAAARLSAHIAASNPNTPVTRVVLENRRR